MDENLIGYFNIQLGYRIIKNIKLTLGYKTGMMEPKYKPVNNFSVGISIVN